MKSHELFASKRLLLIDPDGYCRFFLTEILGVDPEQLTPCSLSEGTKAYELLLDRDFDAVVLGLDVWRERDLAPVGHLRDANDQIPIVVVSEATSTDLAIAAVQAGASDYLTRPFNNLERVQKAFGDAFAKREASRQSSALLGQQSQLFGLLGHGPQIDQLRQFIRQIAPLDISVLIDGESGTGKELIARAIHAQSPRKAGPFIAVNCGALPEGLVESLFFGHEQGAFTGASEARPGYVELAQGGTLLLDEVGELSLRAQPVLLRFIQQREYTRVGGARPLTSDVRVLAATNRNLEGDVEKGRFRADLYYRLNVINLKTVPLRERPDEIAHLATYFGKRFCLRNQFPVRSFAQGALELLTQYSWPGNVRELENLVDGVMAMLPAAKRTVSARDVLACSARLRQMAVAPSRPPAPTLTALPYKEAMERFDRDYFESLLNEHDNNVTQAAKAAGVHPVTFHRKLKHIK